MLQYRFPFSVHLSLSAVCLKVGSTALQSRDRALGHEQCQVRVTGAQGLTQSWC
mgnify:FL=1